MAPPQPHNLARLLNNPTRLLLWVAKAACIVQESGVLQKEM